MQEIIILQPIFQERIWGGKQLNKRFNYEIPSEQTGECWAISAHRNGDCIVSNGALKGQTLSEVYSKYRELFNNCTYPTFPLLTKILDASDDLSVQVHPNDEYAKKHANDLGKTECWYIIDCEPNAEIVYGHNASTKEDLKKSIEQNDWDHLLRRIHIKPGDFFYVPTGTVHALCKGTLVLETQQSSDTTYRVYDYNRLDKSGIKRDLHIPQALDVITVPHQDSTITPKTKLQVSNVIIKEYVRSPYFTVEKWNINGEFSKENDNFLLISVLNGEGTINNQKIMSGYHFIVTSYCKELFIKGNLEFMVSFIE